MGGDYNIYIHTIGTNGQGQSPTTPWQVAMSDEGSGDVVSGGNFNPSSAVRKGASFLQNPDSAIGSLLKTPIGKIGAVGGECCIYRPQVPLCQHSPAARSRADVPGDGFSH